MLVGGGIGTLIVALLVMFLGGDPSDVIGVGTRAAAPGDVELTPEEEQAGEFASTVLASTEDVWHSLFRASGEAYREPTLVLFSDRVSSACGLAGAAVGPFYCSQDERVYVDLAFFDELRSRFGAPGDFAQAYVIAHEVGHNVQTLLGVSQQVHDAQQRLPEAEANALSVRLELQADCYAGVWAHHAHRARQVLEQGDVEEGLAAAAAIGDDRIQQRTQGTVMPESFTHGSSRQRVEWFRRGLEQGDLERCDTFGRGAR